MAEKLDGRLDDDCFTGNKSPMFPVKRKEGSFIKNNTYIIIVCLLFFFWLSHYKTLIINRGILLTQTGLLFGIAKMSEIALAWLRSRLKPRWMSWKRSPYLPSLHMRLFTARKAMYIWFKTAQILLWKAENSGGKVVGQSKIGVVAKKNAKKCKKMHFVPRQNAKNILYYMSNGCHDFFGHIICPLCYCRNRACFVRL
ncbi:MAG: hypothetical protein FWB90_05085 [Fibromonadales bacterium]|nr:hypothetical protein [Fibromonadales bacterium]